MHRLHVDAVAAMAAECARRGSRLVHISTAYVTPHPDGRLDEERPGARSACNIYEATKTMAEHLLADMDQPGIDIVRPAIVLPDDSDDAGSLRSSPLGPFMALAMGARDLPGSRDARLAITRRSDLSESIVRLIDSPAESRPRWWNLVPTPMPELGEITALVTERTGRSFCFRPSSSRRLEPWSPYLCTGRSWETSATAARLAGLGAAMRPVSAELVATWCAALWETNEGNAVA
jgi:nucleoside-diphosphate-sugar epimerase